MVVTTEESPEPLWCCWDWGGTELGCSSSSSLCTGEPIMGGCSTELDPRLSPDGIRDNPSFL